MAINSTPKHEFENRSYGAVMKELGNSTKDLIHSEINLLKAEMKHTAQKISKHLVQAIAFGALLILSVFPFVAFLVIGLGNLLDNRYWLSSLLVAVIFAAIGGPLTLRAFKKIKEEDLKMPRTQSNFDRQMALTQQKLENVKKAAKGERHESLGFN